MRTILTVSVAGTLGLLGLMIAHSIQDQPRVDEWKAWCKAVGGIPVQARGAPDTCFAAEAVITRDKK